MLDPAGWVITVLGADTYGHQTGAETLTLLVPDGWWADPLTRAALSERAVDALRGLSEDAATAMGGRLLQADWTIGSDSEGGFEVTGLVRWAATVTPRPVPSPSE